MNQPKEVKIKSHDGEEIAVALYMPEGDGPFPVLLAASPYRYDNNALPPTPQFFGGKPGPLGFMWARDMSTPIWMCGARASRGASSA